MNFLLLEVLGKRLWFRNGDLDGRQFNCGEVVSVSGDHVRLFSDVVFGTWLLNSTFHRGRPAISCSYFNKRTGSIEKRYFKVFRSDGLYMCGPRYPRDVRPKDAERVRRDDWKRAA